MTECRDPVLNLLEPELAKSIEEEEDLRAKVEAAMPGDGSSEKGSFDGVCRQSKPFPTSFRHRPMGHLSRACVASSATAGLPFLAEEGLTAALWESSETRVGV